MTHCESPISSPARVLFFFSILSRQKRYGQEVLYLKGIVSEGKEFLNKRSLIFYVEF